jgi:hypothetical protein
MAVRTMKVVDEKLLSALTLVMNSNYRHGRIK